MSEIRPSPTSVRVSHSILVTALNVVIHSWSRDSKTQYGKQRERERCLPDAVGNNCPGTYCKGKFPSMEIHFLSEGSGLCVCFPYPELGVTSAPRKDHPPPPHPQLRLGPHMLAQRSSK